MAAFAQAAVVLLCLSNVASAKHCLHGSRPLPSVPAGLLRAHVSASAMSTAVSPNSCLQGPRRRPQARATLSAVMDASYPDVAARVLGWAMSIGGSSLYVPMLVNVLARRPSAEGLSISTWSMQCLGFGAALVYPLRKHFPLSAFFETIALCGQSFAILAGIVWFRAPGYRIALVAAYGSLGWLGVQCVQHAPLPVLAAIQAGASVLMTAALVPQIARNFRRKSSGGWSAWSALLSTIGNGIRIFTTMRLASADGLLLAGYSAGFIMNGIMLMQCLGYDTE